MSGNGSADCAHADYGGASLDGSAALQRRVHQPCRRGGSWNVVPASLRSADRLLITEDSLYFNLGFRVARTLAGP
jgi:formylglycine-generating enzyme required for sulfatase activity